MGRSRICIVCRRWCSDAILNNQQIDIRGNTHLHPNPSSQDFICTKCPRNVYSPFHLLFFHSARFVSQITLGSVNHVFKLPKVSQGQKPFFSFSSSTVEDRGLLLGIVIYVSPGSGRLFIYNRIRRLDPLYFYRKVIVVRLRSRSC